MSELTGKKDSGAAPRVVELPKPEIAEPASDRDERPPSFEYKMKPPPRVDPKPKVNPPSKPAVSSGLLEKPLIRTSEPPAAIPAASRDGALPLFKGEPGSSMPLENETKTLEPEGVDQADQLSKEVLFSRFLAGIIDVALALVLGLTLTLVASWSLKADFFIFDSLEWAAGLSAAFFLLTSLFFLLSSGQTPGMYLTDLRLVSEVGDREASISGVVLRVLLFVPFAATVVGLVWSFFDPLCRCFHDLLSGTRVIPADEE